MKLAYKISLTLILLAGLMCANLEAKQEFTKTVKKEFDITQDGTTSLMNKYGNVNIKTWDKNRVKIDVRIVVKASNEKAAQEVFERVSINFSNGPSFVKAETSIASKSTKWWNNWSGSKSDYSIHYDVTMPPSNNLEVSNKYGDVYSSTINGKIDLNLKYGNFKIDGGAADSEIALAYGNGTLIRTRNTKIDASYAKLTIEEARDIEVNTKYSTFTVGKANDINSYSKYDTYKVDQVAAFKNQGKYDNIDIEAANSVGVISKYTDFYVESVSQSVDLDFEYGGANIEEISSGFSNVRLNGRYTDFKINLQRGAPFKMEASADYAGIRYPEGMTVVYEKDKGSYHEVSGHSGTQSTSSIIKAKLNYGGLKVKQD